MFIKFLVARLNGQPKPICDSQRVIQEGLILNKKIFIKKNIKSITIQFPEPWFRVSKFHIPKNSTEARFSLSYSTRMLVEKSIYNEAIERLRKYANEFKVDDPNKNGEHIGPVISETQFNKIQGLIQKGIDEGAKLVAGGVGKPNGLNDGYYVKPTVFADVKNEMEIARTEIFGQIFLFSYKLDHHVHELLHIYL